MFVFCQILERNLPVFQIFWSDGVKLRDIADDNGRTDCAVGNPIRRRREDGSDELQLKTIRCTVGQAEQSQQQMRGVKS